MTVRLRSCVALFAAAASAPALADDWSSFAGVVALAWAAAGFHALQLLVSAGLAIRRGRRRGWKSGLAYFGGALLMVPVTLLVLTLLSSVADGRSTGSLALDVALFYGLPAMAVWVAFVLAVREHDRLPGNRVWKQTR